MKKPILFALLFFLAAPVAHAYDFGTAGIVAALGTVGAGIALVFGAPAAIGVIAIGSIVAGIQFNHSTPADSVEVQLSPSAALATPVGWTPPAVGQIQPTPPSTAAASVECWQNVSVSISCQSSFGAFVTAFKARYPAQAPYIVCKDNVDPNTGRHFASCTYNGTGWGGSDLVSLVCSAGYTSDGHGGCTLSNPSIVPKPSDGQCTIIRTGNSFSDDPRDPDCSSKPATVAVSSTQVSQTKADGSTKTVTINADGSSTITETRPNNTNNTTETNTTTLSAPDASGNVKVTGQGSGVAPGTGTQAGSSSAPVNVNFDKSGLATEGTLGGIKSSVDAIKDGFDPGSADSSLSTQKSAFDSALDGLTAMFSAEPSKSPTGLGDDFSLVGYLPSQCGCTPLTITFHGHTASYDWCAPIAVFKDVLSWVLGMFTAVYVLSLFRIGGSK